MEFGNITIVRNSRHSCSSICEFDLRLGLCDKLERARDARRTAPGRETIRRVSRSRAAAPATSATQLPRALAKLAHSADQSELLKSFAHITAHSVHVDSELLECGNVKLRQSLFVAFPKRLKVSTKLSDRGILICCGCRCRC